MPIQATEGKLACDFYIHNAEVPEPYCTFEANFQTHEAQFALLSENEACRRLYDRIRSSYGLAIGALCIRQAGKELASARLSHRAQAIEKKSNERRQATFRPMSGQAA